MAYIPSPEAPIDPLNAQAKDLFEVLGAPFDGDLDKMNYQARMSWSPGPDAPIFNENSPVNIWARVLLDSRLDSNDRNWEADIAFVPQEGQLDFTRIIMPLVGVDKSLVLQRLKNNYFLLLGKKGDEETVLTEPGVIQDPANAIALSPQYVEQIVAMARNGLPKIFTDPNDLRLGLAQVSDEAARWTITEKCAGAGSAT